MQHDKVPAEVTRQFKGLWLPVEILNTHMSAIAKLLWADIHSFTGNHSYFFKSNETIAREYGVSQRSVSRAITELKERDLIEVKTDGRVRKCLSRLDNLSMQGRQNGEAGSPKCLHRIQDREQPRKQVSRAKPNSRQEVYIYFNELGLDTHEADKFVDYYESNGWKQGRGKAIKDWQAAARNWKRNAEQWKQKSRGFDAGNFTTDGAIDFVVNG